MQKVYNFEIFCFSKLYQIYICIYQTKLQVNFNLLVVIITARMQK